jgi:hypothetical protein
LDETGTVNAQYYIATTASPADDRARVLKYGSLFFVFDRLGDVNGSPGGEGLFCDGTRFLSELSFTLWNARPLLLSSTVATTNFLFTADIADYWPSPDGTEVAYGTDEGGRENITIHFVDVDRPATIGGLFK